MQVSWIVIESIWIILSYFRGCLSPTGLSDTCAYMQIPHRLLLTLSDAETIKLDLHSNATCSVSNIKSSWSHWDRQTITYSLLPPPPPPQGPRDSRSPLDFFYGRVTICDRGLIDSLLMLLSHKLPTLVFPRRRCRRAGLQSPVGFCPVGCTPLCL